MNRKIKIGSTDQINWDNFDDRLTCLEKGSKRKKDCNHNNISFNHSKSDLNLASQVISNIISGFSVCLLLAWLVTKWWKSDHQIIIMAIGGIFGLCVSVYNVWRSTKKNNFKNTT